MPEAPTPCQPEGAVIFGRPRVATSVQELQVVTTAKGWCDRWQMQANVGANKSVVMLFAPESVPPHAEWRHLLRSGAICWGELPLVPVVSQYK